jgi:general nucleoside transport system ATP-binding protein
MATVLEMKGITKHFASSDVLANDNVDFSVQEGEIHALVGENGAGKTTLMNILYGLQKADRGDIFLAGKKVEIGHPNDAIRLGIGMVHQHFKLVPSFTIAQNIMLGMEQTNAGFINNKDENELVKKLADDFGLPINPTERVRDLPVGMQQRVEILKSLQRNARILILDEPTAVLTPQEVDDLIEVVRTLTKRGCTIIFITHKLLEVVKVADRVSVMRLGRMVGTKTVTDTGVIDMARMMVGREVLFRVQKPPSQPGDVVFSADNLTIASQSGLPAVVNLSLQVRKGEILGIAGVSGNGQTELVEAIAGMRSIEGGSMKILDKDISTSDVHSRREMGLAHIPEDRIMVGLNLHTNLEENVIVTKYKQPEYNRFGFMIRSALTKFAQSIVKMFSIASAQPGEGIATLSGGNMQKVVLGRELSGNPKFIIANQPTRGLDVGSIEFVHQTLLEARSEGVGVLLVSVELEEIMSLSDRIAVLFRGQIVGELDAASATEEQIGILMAGGSLADMEPEPKTTGGVLDSQLPGLHLPDGP